MDRSAERSVAAVLGGGGQVAVARSFVQTASDLSRRQGEVEVMVSELAAIAARQAEPKPPQRLIVRRDRQGNAMSYEQQPIDVAFEREVEELHRRARGNGRGV